MEYSASLFILALLEYCCKDNEVLEGMADSMGKRETDYECVLSW